jgi:hypothetical protein
MKKRSLVLVLSSLVVLGSVGASLIGCAKQETVVEKKDLTVTASKSKIYVGQTLTLTVKCEGKNVSDTLTFASSDKTIATVDANGKVTGVAIGSAKITVSGDNYNSSEISITIAASTQDVTFTFTPVFADGSGVTAFEDGKALWMAGAFLGSETKWGSQILTKNADSTWSITLKNLEFDQTLTYDIYYDDATTFGWKNCFTENVDNKRVSYTVVEGTTAVSQNATFNIPSNVESVVLTVSNLTFADESTLADTTNLYMWNSVTASEVAFTRNADNTFSYTLSNVPIGEYGLKVTFCLGLTAINWDYKSSNYADKYIAIADDTTAVAIKDAEFASQPVPPAAESVTANITATVANIPSNHGDVQIVTDSWLKMTWVSETSFTYAWSGLTAGTEYSFYLYVYDNDAAAGVTCPTDTSVAANLIKFTMATADAAYSLTADFSTGVASIALAV